MKIGPRENHSRVRRHVWCLRTPRISKLNAVDADLVGRQPALFEACEAGPLSNALGFSLRLPQLQPKRRNLHSNTRQLSLRSSSSNIATCKDACSARSAKSVRKVLLRALVIDVAARRFSQQQGQSDAAMGAPSSSGGILGGIHWRDTRRDPLASCSGGILGGIHWRAALAGYWVGAWCRSIANANSNIKSNNSFLSGGEKTNTHTHTQICARRYPPCAALGQSPPAADVALHARRAPAGASRQDGDGWVHNAPVPKPLCMIFPIRAHTHTLRRHTYIIYVLYIMWPENMTQR